MRKSLFFVTLGVIAILVSVVAVLVSAQIDTRPLASQPNFRLVPFADGFSRPLYATHAGDNSGRLFVLEQGGLVWIVRDGERLPTPFLNISSLISPEATRTGGYTERGLLGLAFHPNYAENGQFFVNYTNLNGESVVARVRVSDNPDVADANSVEVLLRYAQPFANHNGGHLAFGPDGTLFISSGDGGAAGDPLRHAQNLATPLGALLRIDVDSAPYAIPEDNPFVGRLDADPLIWAYGLRNAWRFSFDRLTGDLYIADVGQSRFEEINFLPAGSPGGANFGWHVFEATHVFARETAPQDVVMPIFEYPHSIGSSVTGGYVYRSERVSSLEGMYVFGDFVTGVLWAAQQQAAEWRVSIIADTNHQISSFGEDEAGDLYLVDYQGILYRFE